MARNWLNLKWRQMIARQLDRRPRVGRRTVVRLSIVLVLAAALIVLALQVNRAASAPRSPVEVISAQPLHASYAQPTGSTAPVEAQPGQAQADLPVSFYDFGSLGPQAVVRRDFYLVNRGSAPLLVLQAYTTCGCTSADLTASVIPPGKASRITITFDAGFHPVSGQTVRRGLIIETNDPNQPTTEIWVQASIGR
jgi:hypothetical protein